jgi:hypothetical protein
VWRTLLEFGFSKGTAFERCRALPAKTAGSPRKPPARMFGRCANRNSAHRCTVGTILAGDDAAYDGLRWSSHFASSDTTKENQNEDENNVSSGCLVACAIYFRVQREPSAGRNGRTSGTAGTGRNGRSGRSGRPDRPIWAAGGPGTVRATGRDGSGGSNRRSRTAGPDRAAGPTG